MTYVRDNKVVGTQSTGNLPLKVVRAVTAQFVNPPQLDTTSGDRIYRLRSEADIWPLYFLHILAEVGGLVDIAPGRQWQLTIHGEKFLATTPPIFQVPYLFTIWWFEVNWLTAYPFQGMGEDLPPHFEAHTLEYLHKTCPLSQPVSFEAFADGLIEKTGLVWTAQDTSHARMLLHGSIEKMVINILNRFGGMKCHYREETSGGWTRSVLDTIELTKLGQALLDAVVITPD